MNQNFESAGEWIFTTERGTKPEYPEPHPPPPPSPPPPPGELFRKAVSHNLLETKIHPPSPSNIGDKFAWSERTGSNSSFFLLFDVCTHYGHIRQILTHILSVFDNDKIINSPTTITMYIHCHVPMFDIHLRRILWVYCPGHAGVKGNDRADRLAGKATVTGGLRPGRSKVLRSLRHYLRAQDQGHHTIDRIEEREA